MKMEFKYNRKNVSYCSLFFIIAIISVIYSQKYLKGDFTGTPQGILNYVNESRQIVEWNSTTVSAMFFKIINIFNLSTLLEWRIYLELIFNFAFFLFCIRKNTYTYLQYLYLFFSVFILDVFNIQIGKEIVQILIFCIALYITKLRISNSKKAILVFLLFWIESKYFREYYILIGVIYLVSLFLLTKLEDNKTKNIKLLISLIICFFVIILVAYIAFPNYYSELLRVRISNTGDVAAANTFIKSLLPYSNIIYFYLNYLINALRLILPVELLLKGFNISYILFFIYQMIMIYQFIYFLKNSKNNILLSIIIGFYMVSFAFEPDFGSFTRHQANLFFINITLINETKLGVFGGGQFEDAN